jgi:hypothetical protein
MQVGLKSCLDRHEGIWLGKIVQFSAVSVGDLIVADYRVNAIIVFGVVW